MSKEIIIKIPDLSEIKTFLKEKFEKLLSWSFSHLKNATIIVLRDVEKRKWRGMIALILAIGAFFLWDLSSALLWLLFLLFFAYEWENRIIAVLALISLATCPFLLALKRDALAETMAVYAYFFLVMTVALQMVELWNEKKGEVPAEEKSSGKMDLANFATGFGTIIEKLKKIASIKLRKKDTADRATLKNSEKIDLLAAPAEKLLLASLPQAKLLDLPKAEKEAEENLQTKLVAKINPISFFQDLIEKIENLKIKKPKFSKPEFKFDWNIFAFFGLAIVILWKMLLPGYILTLDMVFVPYIPVIINTDGFRAFLPVAYLIHWASVLSSAWLVQKFILVVLFSGIGYMAFKYLPVGKSKIVRWFSALVYLVNPFVYTRLLAGQYVVLAGYALLPPLLHFLLVFEEKKDTKAALKLFGWLFLVGVFSSHFFFMSAMLLLIWFVVVIIREAIDKNKKNIWKFGKNILLGGMMFLILSSYWLIPALTRKAPLEEKFGLPQWEYFAAGGYKEVDPLLNLVSLNGFWGERYSWAKSFAWPQDYPAFWVALSLLTLLMILGIFKGLVNKKEKNKTIIFIVIGICALIFSAGVGETIFRPLNLWFFQHVPLWTGFRDSQKFSGFLALSYAVLAGMGLHYFLNFLKEKKFFYLELVIPMFFLIPFFLGFLVWGGFHGQLKPVQYPDSWFEAKEIVDKDKSKSQVLILPWHGYLSFDFTNDLIIGNPARRFFGERTIAGRDLAMGDQYNQETDPIYLELSKIIQKDEKDSSIVKLLRADKVKYVIFFQDLVKVDDLEYPWLKNEAFELIFKNKELRMYQISKK